MLQERINLYLPRLITSTTGKKTQVYDKEVKVYATMQNKNSLAILKQYGVVAKDVKLFVIYDKVEYEDFEILYKNKRYSIVDITPYDNHIEVIMQGVV